MSDNTVASSYHHLILPEEIVVEILLKLPSKSLIRFKSVSKQWHDLISNPKFLAKHLLPAAEDDHDLLLLKRRDNANKDHVFTFLSGHNHSQTRPLRAEADVQILGHCNGLICLSVTNDVTGHDVMLWSPATGEIKALPPSHVPNPHGAPPEANVVMPKLGFGYDSEAEDYKVIRMSLLEEDDYLFGHKVEVYSFKTDSWKGVADFEIGYVEHRYATCVDGTFLWWANDRILWFRMSAESFGVTMPPLNIDSIALRFDGLGEALDTDYYGIDNKDPSWYKKIFVLNDCNVGLVVYDRRLRMAKCFHVWVLLEFGVEDSWTKLFTVGPLVRIERPLWFWRNGKIIVENIDGELILCNPFTGVTESLDICGVPKSTQIISVKDKYVYPIDGTISNIILSNIVDIL